MSGDNFILLEAYVVLGAMIGAKALYLWVARGQIAWDRLGELAYFSDLMRGGFVFYGGLIGALLAAFAGARLHRIDHRAYGRRLAFLFPLVHGFGRLGCYFAGCCYGIPYSGVFSVRFPVGSLAPAGVGLFPVQLLETMLLWLLAALLFILLCNRGKKGAMAAYLASYSVIRFGLEFLRHDPERGSWLLLSTSQWISLALLAAVCVVGVVRRIKPAAAHKEETKSS